MLVQAVHIISEDKERHKVTQPAFTDLLNLLQALMPANCLPRSRYSFRKASRAVLTEALGGPGFQRLHMCSRINLLFVPSGGGRLLILKCLLL
jgi:hypothetical protein